LIWGDAEKRGGENAEGEKKGRGFQPSDAGGKGSNGGGLSLVKTSPTKKKATRKGGVKMKSGRREKKPYLDKALKKNRDAPSTPKTITKLVKSWEPGEAMNGLWLKRTCLAGVQQKEVK